MKARFKTEQKLGLYKLANSLCFLHYQNNATELLESSCNKNSLTSLPKKESRTRLDLSICWMGTEQMPWPGATATHYQPYLQISHPIILCSQPLPPPAWFNPLQLFPTYSPFTSVSLAQLFLHHPFKPLSTGLSPPTLHPKAIPAGSH